MNSIKGTNTEKNLLAAFAGESQATNRYTFFAKAAKKEGFEQISAIFLETAANEVSHAKRFFRFLEGGDVVITAAFPAGKIGTTAENLRASASGERHEHSTLYPEFAKMADKEGFSDVARVFAAISTVEIQHEKRFLKLLENVEKETVFKREEKVGWKCRVCGYVAESTEAPHTCPVCSHPQAHFELKDGNY